MPGYVQWILSSDDRSSLNPPPFYLTFASTISPRLLSHTLISSSPPLPPSCHLKAELLHLQINYCLTERMTGQRDGKMKESDKKAVKRGNIYGSVTHSSPTNGVGDCSITGRANWCTGWHRPLFVNLNECENAGKAVKYELCCQTWLDDWKINGRLNCRWHRDSWFKFVSNLSVHMCMCVYAQR